MSRFRLRFFVAVFLLFGVSPALLAETVTGTVLRVADGDTLTLQTADAVLTVRLQGVDAPENGQPFSDESTKGLSDLVLGKQVEMLLQGQDKYNRTLGILYLDGCINTKVVERGLAWHYREYSNSKTLADAEKKAKADKVGLWSDGSAIPPWDWRKGTRPDRKPAAVAEDPFAEVAPPKTTGTAPRAPPTTASTPSVTPKNPPRVAASGNDTADVVVYVTNTGGKYHRAGCRHLAKSSIPMSLSQAGAKYSPCLVCNPPLKTATVAPPQLSVPKAAAAGNYWITSSSGIRHNSSCRYYRNSNGRSCGPDEGRACKICGG